MSDEPRYLARRSEVGYTHMISKALYGVGEALSEEAQEAVTQDVHDRDERRRRDVLEESRLRHASQLQHHLAQVRYHEKQLRRLDKRLG